MVRREADAYSPQKGKLARMRRPRQVPRPLIAAATGLLSAAAFPPFGARPLIWIAPIPLLWALDQERGVGWRRAFLLGWIAAATHFVLTLHWILALPGEEVTIPGLMVPALLFLSAYLGIAFGAAAALAVWTARRTRLPVALAWPLFATLADAARSAGELALPWGSWGYALAHATPVLQFASATGFWGLALWVHLVGGLAYLVIRTEGRRMAVATLLVIVFCLPWIHGLVVLSRTGGEEGTAGRSMRISLIQPNTSREIKWDPAFRDIVIDDLLARTRHAALGRPDLIVWPETATPIVLLQEPVYLQRVEETVRELGVPLLAGTLEHHLEGKEYVAHNSAALFDAGGRIVDRYDKRRLVPFSERMPFQRTLPFLAGLNFGQSDFSPGSRWVLFPVGDDTRAGCLICFESIFPEVARGFVSRGAGLLINITNDFWFGDTAAPVQHAEMAVFRAVETRTPLVRCANTGISMVVDPYGRVTHQTRTFVEAQVDARIFPTGKGSFYTRHGEWLLMTLLAIASAWVIAALSLKGRR